MSSEPAEEADDNSFDERLEALRSRLEEDAAKLRDIGDKLMEVSGKILVQEIEEFLDEQE